MAKKKGKSGSSSTKKTKEGAKNNGEKSKKVIEPFLRYRQSRFAVQNLDGPDLDPEYGSSSKSVTSRPDIFIHPRFCGSDAGD